jgi:chromosome segregation ATPase
MQAAQELAAMQAALDKAHAEVSHVSRRLSENEKVLGATQARLRILEPSLAEAQAERVRLSAELEEAHQKQVEAINTQNARLEALQARAQLTESLLEEARQTLMARADEIRSFERRIIEAGTAHDSTNERVAQMTTALAERDGQIRELEQAYDALSEQNEALASSTAAQGSAYGNAAEKIKEQANQIQLLEAQIAAERSTNEMQIEQINAQLQREQLERAMAEGALESGRKDVARLLGEVAAMQHRPLKSAA